MQQFRFRLDTVMKVYKIHQDHAQAALHERLTEDILAKKQLTEYQCALASGTEQADRTHAEPRCVADLLQHRLYIKRLVNKVDQQKDVCRQTQQEVDQARDILIEASRRTRTMENLKAKQFDQYRKNVLRQEQIVLDEIGLRTNNQV